MRKYFDGAWDEVEPSEAWYAVDAEFSEDGTIKEYEVFYSDRALAAIGEDQKGGPGSGHHGHSGRPGKRGGSVPSSSSMGPFMRMEDNRGKLEKVVGYAPPAESVKLAYRHTREMLENAVQRYPEGKGKTPEEVQEIVGGILEEWEDRPISIRRGIGGATNILQEGRFKTQFETGTSGGMFDVGFRTKSENKGLGVPEDIDVMLRPVYGYLNVPGGGLETQYGPIEFVLKDSIKSRTTVVVGDSLGLFEGRQAVGVLIDRMGESPECWDGDRFMSTGFGRLYRTGRVGNYIETQIHGGVTLEDVARIRVHMPGRLSTDVQGAVAIGEFYQLASRLGIDVELVED